MPHSYRFQLSRWDKTSISAVSTGIKIRHKISAISFVSFCIRSCTLCSLQSGANWSSGTDIPSEGLSQHAHCWPEDDRGSVCLYIKRLHLFLRMFALSVVRVLFYFIFWIVQQQLESFKDAVQIPHDISARIGKISSPILRFLNLNQKNKHDKA